MRNLGAFIVGVDSQLPSPYNTGSCSICLGKLAQKFLPNLQNVADKIIIIGTTADGNDTYRLALFRKCVLH